MNIFVSSLLMLGYNHSSGTGASKPSSFSRTPIRKVSKKRAKELRVYNKTRKTFFEDHPDCAVCDRPATEIHHKAGRVGDMMLNTLHWLAVCRDCHRRIEENPTWAKEKGYSESRL